MFNAQMLFLIHLFPVWVWGTMWYHFPLFPEILLLSWTIINKNIYNFSHLVNIVFSFSLMVIHKL